MKVRLVHYKSAKGNVGDDFSDWMFSRLLEGYLDDQSPHILFGIGSILNRRFLTAFQGDASGRRFVFGSGARSADSVPDIAEGDWSIHCVRGPLTASALGLTCDKAVADPAILAPLLLPAQARGDGPIGVVPYFTASHELWGAIAAKLGWTVISPHLSVEAFVSALTQCRQVFCESMHGAIFADAYRIPWRPLSATGASSEGATHAFKWSDWAAAMGVPFDSIQMMGLGGTPSRKPVARLKQRVKIEMICRKLTAAEKQGRFLMSSPAVLESRQQTLMARIDDLRAELV